MGEDLEQQVDPTVVPEEVGAQTWKIGNYMLSVTVVNGERRTSVWELPGTSDALYDFLESNPVAKKAIADLCKDAYGFNPSEHSGPEQPTLLSQT